MHRRAKLLAGGALTVALVGGGTGVALAAGGADTEAPITGPALAAASAAALGHTGGGRVTETEVGDQDGYYEVEVTHGDGSQVDVHLGRDFHVLGATADRERSR
jgi:hypothetical protein